MEDKLISNKKTTLQQRRIYGYATVRRWFNMSVHLDFLCVYDIICLYGIQSHVNTKEHARSQVL